MKVVPVRVLLATCVASATMTGMLLFGVGAVPAGAVTNAVNCGTTNLQTALNAAPSGATLVVHGTCTGNFTIAENLTLLGPATLSGADSGIVLTINAGITVSLRNLTVQDGNDGIVGGLQNLGATTVTDSSFLDNAGGGIDNEATLTVANSTVSGNSDATFPSYVGGGIFSDQGTTMTVTNTTVSGNTATAGGGICNLGTMTVENSDVVNNTASGGFTSGAGLENFAGGTMIVTNTLVHGNSSSGTFGQGGGIDNEATLTLTNSTVFDNSASATFGGFGGGLADFGTATVTHSTLFDNTAQSGGGIFNGYSNLTVASSTIRNNSATDGGGIYSLGSENGTTSLSDSTIAGNTAAYGGGIDLQGGSLTQPVTDRDGVSVHDNTASIDGGGINNTWGGTVALSNASITKNSAPAGGGIYNNGTLTNSLTGIATVSLNNSAVTANSSTGDGGGIYNDGNGGTAVVTFTDSSGGTRVSNNIASEGGGVYNDNDGGSATVNFPSTFTSVTRNVAPLGGGILNLGTLSGHYLQDVYANKVGNVTS
jgi:hypothetical protein